MRIIDRAWTAFAAILLLLACGRTPDLRPVGEGTDRTAPVFPDYRDVTVPCNIAPLNFYYTDPEASRFVTTFTSPTVPAAMAEARACARARHTR